MLNIKWISLDGNFKLQTMYIHVYILDGWSTFGMWLWYNVLFLKFQLSFYKLVKNIEWISLDEKFNYKPWKFRMTNRVYMCIFWVVELHLTCEVMLWYNVLFLKIKFWIYWTTFRCDCDIMFQVFFGWLNYIWHVFNNVVI